MDWTKAEEKLDEIKDAIQTTKEMMAKTNTRVDLSFYEESYRVMRSRYDAGERTEELYREINEFSL